MLATDAMVVPSLKLFDWITELPTFTGMSSIVPSMVERTRVLLSWVLSPVMTIACRGSDYPVQPAAQLYRYCIATRFSQNSSLEITFSSKSFLSLSKVLAVWSYASCALTTLDSALFKETISGISLILAMISPALTLSPGSLKISEMMPDICGLNENFIARFHLARCHSFLLYIPLRNFNNFVFESPSAGFLPQKHKGANPHPQLKIAIKINLNTFFIRIEICF